MGAFLTLLGIYILYNFIVYFVIPVYKTSRKVHEQFRNMQNVNQNPGNDDITSRAKPKVSSKDYIDFEEIKDWF